MLEIMTFRAAMLLRRLWPADRKGVTAVEYGVIAALIVVVCIAALQLVGGRLNTSFSSMASSLSR